MRNAIRLLLLATLLPLSALATNRVWTVDGLLLTHSALDSVYRIDDATMPVLDLALGDTLNLDFSLQPWADEGVISQDQLASNWVVSVAFSDSIANEVEDFEFERIGEWVGPNFRACWTPSKPGWYRVCISSGGEGGIAGCSFIRVRRAWYVDAARGSDGQDGGSFASPFKT